ncbi:superoxide dismutase family protein [Actinomycetospora termitidis]|uniref:Superoxide dismutase family protein n=1 Tax=Actinomycetospora termitidis TaxID=3053470 RepID=A0ABT7MH72_9PSEU|nr:superoxide dismutase family protein [Actinomycetospora sp. Odt1-22]MDL5159212.1 superoxide dismutase family protein [Actinomycetospora sp. Odt1-22]
MIRRIAPFLALIAAALVVAGCSSSEVRRASGGALTAPGGAASTALTYNAAAPAGANVTVETVRAEDSTAATLTAQGLLPDRGYAAHLHTRPCGPTGNDAGPHFQNRVDPAATPEKPSSDPAYANPQNEFWLDLRTDASGAGTATTTVPFALTDRAPASLIVHEKEMTAIAPGQAGTAGGRLACVTLTP